MRRSASENHSNRPGIRHLTRFFLLMIVGVAFIAFSTAWAAPGHGGRVTFGGENDSWGFDAIKARNLWGIGAAAGNMVMERLFELGPDRKLVPVLGLSAELSADRKSWTVQLRRGVKFHDGMPFNAEAVVHHWQRLLNPDNHYRGRFMVAPIESVEKTGEYSVVFHLRHPWLPFIDALTNERGFTALIPSPQAVDEGTQNRAPVGTGPFVFKEWKSADSITVERNPDYWQEGMPYLDEVVLKVIPDHETRYAALVSGQVDLIATDRPEHVKKLLDQPRFSVERWNAGIGFFALNTTKPPLDDLRVRRALAHAWDQETYLRAAWRGIYEPARDILSGKLGCTDVGYKGHDLDAARAELAEYGKPVELEYLHTSTLRGREAGAITQQLLKQAGITLNPVPMNLGGIVERMLKKNFDMASWVLARASDMGPVLYASFHSNGPWNMTKFSNAEVDELLEKQRFSQDPEERREIFCRIARIVNDNVPLIYLFQRDYYLFIDKKIKGVPCPAYALVRLAGAWLEE